MPYVCPSIRTTERRAPSPAIVLDLGPGKSTQAPFAAGSYGASVREMAECGPGALGASTMVEWSVPQGIVPEP